ncbi:hypothetical protein D3C77_357250 [compost metagenome]
MRTSGAYPAAYPTGFVHCACVKIVREVLRETGLILPAKAARFVDTSVDTGRSGQRQRPDKNQPTCRRLGQARR